LSQRTTSPTNYAVDWARSARSSCTSLLYFVQGWHLAAFREPLFRETINAWEMGPVVADLWADEKHDRGRPTPRPLLDEQAASIDYIVERYGHLTGTDLMRITHADGPWREAFRDQDQGDVIGLDSLAAFFSDDEGYREYLATVARLRRERPVSSLISPALPPDLARAVDRVVPR
jgi:uncharacterized phage-associated protein